MSKFLKISSVAGGLGTIGGITGTIFLAAQRPDLEATKEIAAKEAKTKILKEAKEDLEVFIKTFKITEGDTEENLFKAIKEKVRDFKQGNKIDFSKIFFSIDGADKEIIGAEKVKFIFSEGDPDTKEEIESLEENKLTDVVGVEGLHIADGKNNLCDLIQREGVRRILEKNFKYGEKYFEDFTFAFTTCLFKK